MDGYLNTQYDEIETLLDEDLQVFWCYMKPKHQPCYTVGLVLDLLSQFQSFERFASSKPYGSQPYLPMKYIVTGSRIPGVYNYGGDLKLFTELIQKKDRASLFSYARLCIDTLYLLHHNFQLDVVTIALLEGDALGGGFEMALGHDLIIAEKKAKFGMTEILFNCFPGMGAYSILSRRIGTKKTEEIVFSGKTYSAEEMKEIGLVDIVAENGKGKETLANYIHDNKRRFKAHQMLYKIRRRCSPLDYKELLDITNMWVDATLDLNPRDLRKMSRLASLQTKKLSDSEAKQIPNNFQLRVNQVEQREVSPYESKYKRSSSKEKILP